MEGVWSVLGTPRSWFWYTFCICDSPFLVLVHFLDVCPRVARPRVACPRVARPPVDGRGWVWRVCGRGCGRGVECAWTPLSWFWYTFCICDSPFLVLVHFLDVCPRVARPRVARPRVTRVREWRVSASGACPRVAPPRVARVRVWRVREWRVSASGASASGACPQVEGRGWVWRVCGRGCGRGVECAWDSALLVLVHFLYLRLSRSWLLVHFLDVCPRVARPRVARPRVARPPVEGRGWVWRVCGRGCGRGV